MCVFNNIFAELTGQADPPDRLIIDSDWPSVMRSSKTNHRLKAHRTAASLLKKGLFPAVSFGRKAT
jgi:putative transposase